MAGGVRVIARELRATFRGVDGPTNVPSHLINPSDHCTRPTDQPTSPSDHEGLVRRSERIV